MTNVPTVMPSLRAKMTAMTSMPSIAPPPRMASPLPTPEINPPKSAQSSRSVPASGEEMLTSSGKGP